MERPPTIPSRPFSVRRARRSPSRTEIVTRTGGAPSVSRTARAIMRRGTGLIAGPPTGMPRPGRVTTPTPVPARSSTAAPPTPRATAPGPATVQPRPVGVAPPSSTSAPMWAPWVTSGSSPASLTTQAPARRPSVHRPYASKSASKPAGRGTVTVAGDSPRRARQAAAVAAAAQAPVVKPVRSPRRLPSPPGSSLWLTYSPQEDVQGRGGEAGAAPGSGDDEVAEAGGGQRRLGRGGELETGAGGDHAGGRPGGGQVEQGEQGGGRVADRHHAAGAELVPAEPHAGRGPGGPAPSGQRAGAGSGDGHGQATAGPAADSRRHHAHVDQEGRPPGQGPARPADRIAAQPDEVEQRGVAGGVDERRDQVGLRSPPAPPGQGEGQPAAPVLDQLRTPAQPLQEASGDGPGRQRAAHASTKARASPGRAPRWRWM